MNETSIKCPDFPFVCDACGGRTMRKDVCSICAEQSLRERDERARARAITASTIATIPPALRWATFEAAELRARVCDPSQIEVARVAIDDARVVLVGSAGAGKSSLAAAMLRAWTARTGKPATFMSALPLAYVRAQAKLGTGEPELVREAIRAPLLLIDDVATDRATTTNALVDIVFARFEREVPTWITTWANAKAIADRYGDGVARRFYEGATVIDLKPQSGAR